MTEPKFTDLYEMSLQFILDDGGSLSSSWYTKMENCQGKSRLKRFFTWVFYLWSFQTEKTHNDNYVGPVQCDGIRFFGYSSETYKRLEDE